MITRQQSGQIERLNKKELNNSSKATRRSIVKGVVIGLPALAVGAAAVQLYKFFSQDDLYQRARNNPELQKQWIQETLRRYGKDSLYNDVIILTPQNANQYANEYPRYKTLDTITTSQVVSNVIDLGTERVPKPKLFVPSNFFSESEGDLTSIIALHEANHAKVLRSGFDFMKMQDFYHKDNSELFINAMFQAVNELEAHKEELEKGSNMMSSKLQQNSRREYLNYYVQLWRYGDNIKEETATMLKTRYFQPWMRNSNAIAVFFDETDNSLRYERTLNLPLIIKEGDKFYMQFMFRQGPSNQLYKLPLPNDLRLN